MRLFFHDLRSLIKPHGYKNVETSDADILIIQKKSKMQKKNSNEKNPFLKMHRNRKSENFKELEPSLIDNLIRRIHENVPC